MISFVEDVSVLTNNELLQYSVKLAQHEKEVGLRIITCLREAEKRRLFCEVGCGSLWDFATRYLGLSNGNAQSKIDAMRLSRDNPIAQKKIETGELSILNAAKVNSFFRNQQKAGKTYTPEQKAEVIESVVGLSQSNCERALATLAPESIPTEKIRSITDTKTELKIVVDDKTMEQLQRLKELLSHKMPNASIADLLDYLVCEKVELLEKKQMGEDARTGEKKIKGLIASLKQAHATATPIVGVSVTDVGSQPCSSKNSVKNTPTPRKYISVHDRRWVLSRAQGQCENIGKNGERCKSKFQIQIDHVIPLALGGSNDRSNYRALCRQCNVYYAKLHLGKIMNQYVPSLN